MSDDIGIYAIENLRDRRAYIGATRLGFQRRWAEHRCLLDHGRHHVVRLQVDWDTYGPGWFKFIPLDVLPTGGPFAPHEQYWIDALQAYGYDCYNGIRASEHRLRPIVEVDRSLDSEREAYTLLQSAHRLHVTPRTLRNWITHGKISAFKLGLRQWRIRHEEVSRFLKHSPHEEPPDAPYGEDS